MSNKQQNITKLKILFLHTGIKDGEDFGRNFMLARELAFLGNSVTLLTSQYGIFKFPYHKEKRDGVIIISFPDIVPRHFRKAGLGVLNIILRAIYSLSHKFDIVHSGSGHRPSAGVPCRLNQIFRKSKYISEWWDYYGKGGKYGTMPWWYQKTLGNFDTWAEIHNKKKADGVVALSKFTKQRAINIGVKEENILILHGGADIDFIKFVPNTNNKTKFGIPESYLTFGFIGIDDGEIKDIEPFLYAVNELKENNHITWFSTGKKLSNKTKAKYNIGKEYFEFGWIPYESYSDLLSCADCFILLLKDNKQNNARWPNKSGDYLAAGRPIMVNLVGEIKEYVYKYPKSFIVVNWDKESIKYNIIKLQNMKNKIISIGKNNRNIAEKNISWKIQGKKLESFYYKILNQ